MVVLEVQDEVLEVLEDVEEGLRVVLEVQEVQEPFGSFLVAS